jgi:hypothetical protein
MCMCIIYSYISILLSNTAVLIGLLELNLTSHFLIRILEQPQNQIEFLPTYNSFNVFFLLLCSVNLFSVPREITCFRH